MRSCKLLKQARQLSLASFTSRVLICTSTQAWSVLTPHQEGSGFADTASVCGTMPSGPHLELVHCVNAALIQDKQ